MNFSAFSVKPTTTKINKGLNFSAFGGSPVKTTPVKVGKLPDYLGGGSFNQGQGQELIKTERGYAGIEAPGRYREHIFPVALGGTSDFDNIKVYGKDLGQQKSDFENDIIRKYKAGELTLGQARGEVLKKFRELTGLDPKQGVNLWEGLKEAVLNPIESFKKAVNLNPSTTKAVEDLVNSVDKGKTSPPTAVKNAVASFAKSMYETDKEELDRIKDFFGKNRQEFKDKSTSEKVGEGLKVLTGGVGVVLSPITAFFEAGKELPIISTAVSAINLPLAIAGDSAKNISDEVLNTIPMEDKTREDIRQGVNEISELAAQIAVAGKMFKETKVFKEKKAELEKKYGEQDAATIIKKAEEIVELKETKLSKDTKLNTDAFKKTEPKIEPKTEIKTELSKQEIKSLNKFDRKNYNLAKKLPPVEEGKIRVYQTGVGDTANGVFKKGSYVDTSLTEHIARGTEKEAKLFKDFAPKEFKSNFEQTSPGIFKVKKDTIGEIYNDFAKPIEYKPIKKVAAEQPKVKTSKLALGVEEKAIAKKLSDGFEGLPEYAEINVKQQAKLANELVKTKLDDAIKIAKGEKLPPEGILPESVFTAVENYAIKKSDVGLMQDLAQSGLSLEATGMGQRLRLLAERAENSPIGKIKKVVDARKKFVEGEKGKNYKKIEKEEINNMKKEIKKSKPTKDAWLDFVESIKC